MVEILVRRSAFDRDFSRLTRHTVDVTKTRTEARMSRTAQAKDPLQHRPCAAATPAYSHPAGRSGIDPGT